MRRTAVRSESHHPCPAPNCPQLVQDSMLACRRHWFELPAELRARIWEHYRSGDRVQHMAAVREAHRFWRGETNHELSESHE